MLKASAMPHLAPSWCVPPSKGTRKAPALAPLLKKLSDAGCLGCFSDGDEIISASRCVFPPDSRVLAACVHGHGVPAGKAVLISGQLYPLADEHVASREEAGCYLPGSDPQKLLDAGDVEVVPAAGDKSTGLARRGNVRCQDIWNHKSVVEHKDPHCTELRTPSEEKHLVKQRNYALSMTYSPEGERQHQNVPKSNPPGSYSLKNATAPNGQEILAPDSLQSQTQNTR
ncbi:hypothetical protein Anapl_05853 [Anas platyrhynchos]|uniref:Uncharacterized protein n=1 Tax=Anas platyrhynchos TaxID=8839 RepID=R0KEW1_ANAPL|nr:hypothetical protein Anapl_05853 [Anas platyrhynchos]